MAGETRMIDADAQILPRRRKLFFAAAFALSALLGGCSVSLPDVLTTGSTSKADTSPNSADLMKPGPLPERTLGNANAPVTVIEYASLGCPLCGAFHKRVFPKFKTAYIDTGKVRYIYREFPIGASSALAAHAARCAPESQYFRINDKFMASRGRWNARTPDPDLIYKIVQDTGLSRTAFDSCLSNQKISDGINWVKQQGRELGVKGTPTFFINGQQVRGAMSFEEMQRVIEQHLNLAAKPA